jgi:hypothetical protein
MPCIQKLQKINSLAAANLAQDDSVWPMAEGRFQKVTDRYSRKAVLLAPSFESENIVFLNLYLSDVLYQDNALMVGNEFGQYVGEGGLATLRSTADQDVLALGNIIQLAVQRFQGR